MANPKMKAIDKVALFGYDDSTKKWVALGANTSGSLITEGGGLVDSQYDYIVVTSSNANGDPLVIVYKEGGASGTTVATLTITYDANGNFESVTST